MVAVPVLTFENNTLLTAVAATSTSDYTVVFLGTSEGHLKKVSALCSLSVASSLDLHYSLTSSPLLFVLELSCLLPRATKITLCSDSTPAACRMLVYKLV